jgi:radical SAM superfamily enzyme YgiQ (UPF0313 family)
MSAPYPISPLDNANPVTSNQAVHSARVVLISPYELGRQPFGIAEPAALLRDAGHEVSCVDLSQERLQPEELAGADLIALHLAMHTATRIAVEALPRIREINPHAIICAYGLYAVGNAELLGELGVSACYGGEAEPLILALAAEVADGSTRESPVERAPVRTEIFTGRLDFVTPDRSKLPPLTSYTSLQMPDGRSRRVGFAESTRGCKHLCRHCPVVPVYNGRFRAIPAAVVMSDIEQQLILGAEHISFGDPDFLNGPTHARRIIEQMHEQHPEITWDATIKVEHILANEDLLERFAKSGCLFVTTAVESVDDQVLGYLLKNHQAGDFALAVALLRRHGIAMAPTFVAFTPWTTAQSYVALLQSITDLELVNAVPSIQLAIRLLVPTGSHLLQIDEMTRHLGPYDSTLLGYPWAHPDPRVDELAQSVMACVETAEANDASREDTFTRVWELAHAALGKPAPALPARLGAVIPHHDEPWYCCAEPTSAQLQSF